MKNLFEAIVAFENLLLASRKARLGKRFQANVAAFEFDLEKNLLRLQRELLDGSYRPGVYRGFWITDPKPRLISAAPYRDRVVHHALCSVIEPIFDRTFIFDSYACRQRKGTHGAIERFQAFAARNRYVLKCDIRKYFPSIDHDILFEAISRKIGCRRTLALIRLILDNSNEQETVVNYFPEDDLWTPYERRHGIPIGNLTSQLFANVHLNGFDHFMKEQLGQRFYVRYVDDFGVFGDDKQALWAVKEAAESFLAELRLRLHPLKCHVFPTVDGAEFLGFRVFPTHRVPLKRKARQYLRHLRKLSELYGAGQVRLDEVKQSIRSWLGHVSFGGSYRLRRSVLSQVSFVAGRAERVVCCAAARGTTIRGTAAPPTATGTRQTTATTTRGFGACSETFRG
jgi:retron-type reverse transcriptase